MRVVALVFCAAVTLAGLVMPILLMGGGTLMWSPPRLLLYGAVPVIISAVASWGIWHGDAARKLLLAYGVAMVVAALSGELYLRSRVEAVLATVTRDAVGSATLRAQGIRAYPHICGIDLGLTQPLLTAAGDPVHPVTGVSANLLTPHLEDQTRWRFSDQFGFNNPPDQWSEPKARILALGDSFTFGLDVPIGRGFIDRLRERGGKVVNLGCSGNGPLLELAGLVEYGPVLQPPIVLWVYYEGNDLIGDLPAERMSPILSRYLEEGFSQSLAARRDQLDGSILAFLDKRVGVKPAQAALVLKRAGWLPALDAQTFRLTQVRRALGLAHKYPDGVIQQFSKVLARAKTVAETWGGRVVLVYLPDETRYATMLGAWDAETYAGPVRKVASELGLPVIDIAAAFDRHPSPRGLFRGHYTEEGYKLVGDAIFEALRQLPPAGR